MLSPVDVKYEILWRKAGTPDGGGPADTVLATYNHHFEPKGGGDFSATAYEDTVAGPAAPAEPGDQLVLRVSVSGTTASTAFVVNGDTAAAGGRDPFIDLPR